MAGEGRYGVLHVPDFVPGKESMLRIGATADDEYTWRDHTDGNRITTTRGDKIEIIGGNYTLSVLGRQKHQSGASSEEGRAFQNSITHRGTFKIEGKKITEETVKGDVTSTFYGDVFDHYDGSLLMSVTGSESPHVGRENPTILQKTWAREMKAYVGSEALRVPLMKDETWAVDMVTKTDVKTMTEETTVEEEQRSTTTARTLTSETTADSMSDTTEVANEIESDTRMSKTISTTHADTKDDMYGDSRSYQQGNTVAIVEGIENTVNLGMVNEVVVGLMTDVTVGATVETTVGIESSVTIGGDATITVGVEIEISLGQVELQPSKVKLQLDRMKAMLFRKNIAAVNLLA